MKPGQASRTAEYMALFRALESTRSAGQRICEDPFARKFLGSRLRHVVGLSRFRPVGALVRSYIDHRWPGARTSAVARPRFIDDVAEASVGSGIEQVVILGAGFDARAYRIAALASLTVFEVDHPSTSAGKRRIVEAAVASTPRHSGSRSRMSRTGHRAGLPPDHRSQAPARLDPTGTSASR